MAELTLLSAGATFATGPSGVVLHYDGAAWSPISTGINAPLYALDGIGPADILASSATGVVLHHDGRSWREMKTGSTLPLSGLGTRPGVGTYAVGKQGSVLRLTCP